jgi:hypothetical protein
MFTSSELLWMYNRQKIYIYAPAHFPGIYNFTGVINLFDLIIKQINVKRNFWTILEFLAEIQPFLKFHGENDEKIKFLDNIKIKTRNITWSSKSLKKL